MQPTQMPQPIPPPMIQQPMQQAMYMPTPVVQNPQVYGQPNAPVFMGQMQNPMVTVIDSQQKLITCTEIIFQCLPPHFNCCNECIGCCTACSSGGALSGGVFWCCYGCNRPDCCQVWCSGCALVAMSWFFYGIVASCIVGMRMMKCC